MVEGFPRSPFPADDPLDGERVDATGDDDRGDPTGHGPSSRANLRACTTAATPGQTKQNRNKKHQAGEKKKKEKK